MPLLERETTDTGVQVENSVQTKSAAEDALKSSEAVERMALSDADLDRLRPAFRKGWQEVINEPLIEWGRDPSQLEDDGIEPPSRDLITFALRYAMSLRDAGWAPPTRVVPNGDGGLAFENNRGPYFQSIEFDEDGTVELLTFINGKLQSRQKLAKKTLA